MNIDYSIHYRQFHDGSLDDYYRVASWMKHRLSPFLPANKTARILDIGCGFGFCVFTLNQLGYSNAKGIDISVQQVQQGLQHRLSLEHVEDTINWLSLQECKFDHVILFDVLEHIEKSDQISFMASIHKSLKPGAAVHIRVPNANSPVGLRWRYIDQTHYTSYTEYSIKFLLLSAGFQESKFSPDQLGGRPSIRIWNKAARQSLRQYAFRLLWKQLYIAEFGESILNEPCIRFDRDFDILAHK